MLIPLPSLATVKVSCLPPAFFSSGLAAVAVTRLSGFEKILLSPFNGVGIAFSGRRVRSVKGHSVSR